VASVRSCTKRAKIPSSLLTMESEAKVRTSEADLQRVIVQTLAAVGYESLEIGQARRMVTCPHCKGKHTPTGYMGNTPGTPDLFVGLAAPGAFPLCTWVGLELKRSASARVRPEQAELYGRGRVAIVTTPREALEDLQAVLRSLSAYTAPAALLEALERLKRQL
jgi:hypothetical protein